MSPPPNEPPPQSEGIDPDSIMRIDTLCHSLCGNPIFTLTITNDIDSYLSSEQEIYQFRRFEYDGNGELKTVV